LFSFVAVFTTPPPLMLTWVPRSAEIIRENTPIFCAIAFHLLRQGF
jgi:hypothetical protein